jgi:hypothetical protein
MTVIDDLKNVSKKVDGKIKQNSTEKGLKGGLRRTEGKIQEKIADARLKAEEEDIFDDEDTI